MPMMNCLADGFSWIALHWWSVLIACALGVTLICARGFETDEARIKRAERTKKQELRALADKISAYGRNVHKRFPTGDVVMSEPDLAAQLRKHPDAVITALNLLLREQKVQKAPLNGYWKLNV